MKSLLSTYQQRPEVNLWTLDMFKETTLSLFQGIALISYFQIKARCQIQFVHTSKTNQSKVMHSFPLKLILKYFLSVELMLDGFWRFSIRFLTTEYSHLKFKLLNYYNSLKVDYSKIFRIGQQFFQQNFVVKEISRNFWKLAKSFLFSSCFFILIMCFIKTN